MTEQRHDCRLIADRGSDDRARSRERGRLVPLSMRRRYEANGASTAKETCTFIVGP